MKSLKGYRTIAFNAIMLLAAVLGAAWTPEQVNEWLEAFAIVWAGGNAGLRYITDSPIFKGDT